MLKKIIFKSLFCAIFSVILLSNVFGVDDSPNSLKSRKAIFMNPAVNGLEQGCYSGNLNSEKFSKEISLGQKVAFCEALQKISNQLVQTNWSPKLRAELQQIWTVFLTQNVKIRPMKKGVSSRILAAAEAFTNNEKGAGFNASLYLRPKSAGKKSFFLVSMHELRHVYDYYLIWKNKNGITQAELEKRGFKIMGKIARETREKEKFKRLPKLWDDKWRNLSDGEINAKMDTKIRSYMRKSRFYKHLIKNPNQYIVGYKNSPSSNNLDISDVTAVSQNKGEALPYLVKTQQSAVKVKQNVEELSFELKKPTNSQNSDELLKAALANEKALYYKMDNFVYDQNLKLKCWKKKRVIESFLKTRQVARTNQGKALFERENVKFTSRKKKATKPSCLLNIESIDTDSTETFWSAPYLDEMQVKFDYFTELDGVKVARYTVYKPSMTKFNKMAARYPFIKPFRVFFGSIFVSIEDAQIIKFWGSSFPEATTTGHKSNTSLASYNATAIREKLESGVWVTTMLNTVAVANKRGKMKPFSYVVQYKNYRQGVSDMVILDDEEVVAVNN